VLNNPTSFIDPLGLQGGDWVPRFQYVVTRSGGSCYVDQIKTPCVVANAMLAAGTAVMCPNNDCSGIRVAQGPGGTTLLQQWVPGQLVSIYGTLPGGGIAISEFYFQGYWKTTGTSSGPDNSPWDYAWIAGLAPGANGFLQALKQQTKGLPGASEPPTLRPAPGPTPEIQLEDPFMARVFTLMSRWLRGGGIGPLPPSTTMVPIVSPCVFPSFQNTQICGGAAY
jgi:hypothetical protein